MKRLLLAFSLTLLTPLAARGEGDTLRFTSMEEVKQQNLWLSGQNPAGLSLNRFHSFSVARAGYAYGENGFGMLGRPSSTDAYSVAAESYQRLDQVSLYGMLSYALRHNRQQSWNSMSGEPWASVNLADSMPGQQKAEQYHLAGGLSFPLHRRWTVGAQADYRVQLTAKETDPRNRNQWMEWQFTPGVSYLSGELRLGASLLYAVQKESVGIRNMGTHATYPLFAAYPLAFFRTLPQEGEVNWHYRSRRMGAALQAHTDRGSFELFQQLSAGILRQEVESNRMQNRSEGKTDGWQAEYRGSLQQQRGSAQHKWDAEATLRHTRSYDPLQRQPEGGLWQTYGRVLRSTHREAYATLTYRFRRMRDALHSRYGLLASVRYHRAVNTLLFYPTEYSQPTHRITAHVASHRHILLPNDAQLHLSLGIQGGYGGGTLLRESSASAEQESPDITLWQNELLRQQNFDYETGLRWGLTPTVGYTRPLPRGIGSWFIHLTGHYERGRSLPQPNRQEIIAQIGWLF